MSDRTQWIVRAAMTEYMILMAGALALYAACEIWPHAIAPIALVGGLGLAALCIVNFLFFLRLSGISTEDSSQISVREE
jgi:hypothetical protein